MERISESIGRTNPSFTVKDPYATAHALMHWAEHTGRVVERENRILTDGPHTRAEVKFYVEKKFDKFTHIHVVFSLTGNISAKTLSGVIEASLVCVLPTPHGMASKTFNEVYLTRFLPSHMKRASDIAAEFIGEARKLIMVNA